MGNNEVFNCPYFSRQSVFQSILILHEEKLFLAICQIIATNTCRSNDKIRKSLFETTYK